jgi:O-antigen/teichoic acid export membrane protein
VSGDGRAQPGDVDQAGRAGESLSIGGRRGGLLIGAAAAASALFGLASQVLLERALGVQGFAEWAYLSAFLAISAPLACMGSGHLLLSSALKEDLADRAGLLLLASYFGSFTLLAMAVFALGLTTGAPGNLMTVPWALLYGALLVQIPVVLVFPVYQRRRYMRWVAGWPLLQSAVRLFAAIAALIFGFAVMGVLVTWAVLSLGLVFVAVRTVWPLIGVRMRQSSPANGISPSLRARISRLYGSGIGFGLSDLLDSLDLKLIVPLAALLFGVTETAAAGLATILLAAVQFFPYVLVMRVLLPAVHSGSDAMGQALRTLVLRLSAFATLALVPLVLAFLCCGLTILGFVVRGDYSSQEAAISWLGICFIPLCVSQVAAAPHMARRDTWRLFGWRVEALALFVGAALSLSELGLLAIVIGFAAGRTWLCVRVFWALRFQPEAR